MAQTKIPKPMAKIFSGGHQLLYKLSKGKFGATMGKGSVGLLTTVGRKSGKSRTVPLMYIEHPDGWVITASASGHDVHPGWYHNLKARDHADFTIGDVTHTVSHREMDGHERTEIWDRLVSANGDFGEYQKVTDRLIPVIVLAKA